MMPEDHFDTLFADRGGRAEIADETLCDFHAAADQFIQKSVAQVYESRGIRPDVFLGFYRRAEIGGTTKKRGNSFYIGLSQSLRCLLRDLFLPLVTTGRPLSFLRGRPGQGRDDAPHPTETDLERTEILTTLLSAELAWSIFEHELAHVLNGHVGFLEEESRNGSVDPMTHQALEMDADSVSVSLRLSRMVEELGWAVVGHSEWHSPRARLFVWGFATYAQFRIEASREKFAGSIFEQMQDYTHTPPQVRMIQIQACLLSCLLVWKTGASRVPPTPAIDALLAASSVLAESVDVAERAIAEARRESVDWVPVDQGLHEEAQALSSRQTKAWALIRPRLEKYAFVPLAPAVDPLEGIPLGDAGPAPPGRRNVSSSIDRACECGSGRKFKDCHGSVR
jgi:hypothetical protein